MICAPAEYILILKIYSYIRQLSRTVREVIFFVFSTFKKVTVLSDVQKRKKCTLTQSKLCFR